MADKEEGWMTGKNALTALVVVDTAGLVALAWWSTSKISELEKNESKLTKKIDKLEKRVDALSKMTSKPDQRLKIPLDRNHDKLTRLEEDVENIQAKIESLADCVDTGKTSSREKTKKFQSRGYKSVTFEPSESSEESDNHVEELESDDFEAIYKQEEKKKKSTKKRR